MKRLFLLLALALVAAPAVGHAQPDPTATKKAKKKPAKKAKKAAKKAEPAPDPAPAVDPAVELEPPPPPAPVAAAPAADPEPAPAAPRSEPATLDTEVAVKATAPAPHEGHRTIYFRAGGTMLQPFSQSRELELADVDGAASLAIKNGPVAGSGSTIDGALIPAAIIGYQITSKISIETVLGLPFTVKFKATGTLKDMSLAPSALGIPTGVPPLGEDIGEAKAAPPVITAVYQLPHLGPIRPFAGTGLAVLFTYGGKITNPILSEVKQPDFEISPAPGLVLQSGAEVKLWSSVYARLDVKFIAFMLARATVSHIQVKTPELPLFDTVEVGTAKMSVWVNPLIVSLGVGADF